MTPPPSRTLGPLTRTDFVRYQGASGDMNPIHHDEPFARAAGFEAPLAVGMLAAGAMNAWASDWLGPANVRRTRIRWRKPAFPGTLLTISGTVERTYVIDGEERVDLLVQAVDQDGDVAVQGWMTFRVSP